MKKNTSTQQENTLEDINTRMEKALELIAQGMSIEKACRQARISTKTFYKLKDLPQWAEKYMKAREKGLTASGVELEKAIELAELEKSGARVEKPHVPKPPQPPPPSLFLLEKEEKKSLSPAEKQEKKMSNEVKQEGFISTRGEVEEAPSPDPLEKLLKTPWEIECDNCKKTFTHSFTDEEIKSLEENGYTYVECPHCKDSPPGDFLGIFSYPHRIFIRLSDLFRAYLLKSKSIRIEKPSTEM